MQRREDAGLSLATWLLRRSRSSGRLLDVADQPVQSEFVMIVGVLRRINADAVGHYRRLMMTAGTSIVSALRSV